MLLQTPPPMLPFDPNQIIPLVGAIGGMVVTGVVFYSFFKSEIAKALGERIRGRRKHVELDSDPGHVADLEQRVAEMQGQLNEMAERLDFAERLLASKRERLLPGA